MLVEEEKRGRLCPCGLFGSGVLGDWGAGLEGLSEEHGGQALEAFPFVVCCFGVQRWVSGWRMMVGEMTSSMTQ